VFLPVVAVELIAGVEMLTALLAIIAVIVPHNLSL
jgi:hypothetical protein